MAAALLYGVVDPKTDAPGAASIFCPDVVADLRAAGVACESSWAAGARSWADAAPEVGRSVVLAYVVLVRCERLAVCGI